MKGKKLTVYLSMIAFIEAALLSVFGWQMESTGANLAWLYSTAGCLLVVVTCMYGMILIRLRKTKK
jgi:hypothetical protein